MKRIEHLKLMARYNQWMNDKVYTACRGLSEDDLQRDRGAFFQSIFGTLNHLAVADTLWLKRFAKQVPALASHADLPRLASPTSLDGALFTNFAALAEYRTLLDGLIFDLVAALEEDMLDQPFSYTTSKGVPMCKDFSGTLAHFFNHQTHHRGQTTTLLTQLGMDVGATDLLLLLPELE